MFILELCCLFNDRRIQNTLISLRNSMPILFLVHFLDFLFKRVLLYFIFILMNFAYRFLSFFSFPISPFLFFFNRFLFFFISFLPLFRLLLHSVFLSFTFFQDGIIFSLHLSNKTKKQIRNSYSDRTRTVSPVSQQKNC